MNNGSITGRASFNARVSPPEQPKPTVTPEGSKQPAAPVKRYTSSHEDYVPSEHRGTEINTDAIRDSVARTLAAHDRQVAEANGAEVWREDAARLNASVRKGEITPAAAEHIFKTLHPEITPEQLQRGQK